MEPNWDSITETSRYINEWAQRTFPGRVGTGSLTKLVMEEIPELLRHRKERGMDGIGGELADCFILLFDLAVLWKVNLPAAIKDKMFINERRMWVKDKDLGHYNHADLRVKCDPCSCTKTYDGTFTTEGEERILNPECPIHGGVKRQVQQACSACGGTGVVTDQAGNRWPCYRCTPRNETGPKCDGEHSGPPCGDPECWNDDTEGGAHD